MSIIPEVIRDVGPWFMGAGGLAGWALFAHAVLTNRRLAPKSKAEAQQIVAAAMDQDWQRFQREIDRLVKRCEVAENTAGQAIAGFRACEEREIVLKGRVAELEAINRGRGQLANEVHTLAAAERIVSEHTFPKAEGGGDKPSAP